MVKPLHNSLIKSRHRRLTETIENNMRDLIYLAKNATGFQKKRRKLKDASGTAAIKSSLLLRKIRFLEEAAVVGRVSSTYPNEHIENKHGDHNHRSSTRPIKSKSPEGLCLSANTNGRSTANLGVPMRLTMTATVDALAVVPFSSSSKEASWCTSST